MAHRRELLASGLRDRWVRGAIAVVVGLKLVGFIPFVGALTTDEREERTPLRPAAALAADPAPKSEHAVAAPQAVRPEAPKVGPVAAPPAPDPKQPPATAPRILPGDPPPDGPSAAFAEQSRVLQGLLEAIQRRSAELDLREAELVQRETALDTAEENLDKKIAHLEQLAQQATPGGGAGSPAAPQGIFGAATAAAAAAPASSMDQLGRIYGAMKAEEAAPLLDRLDDETVHAIFANMKQKQISAILPLMNPDKAVALTELLGGRRSTRNADEADSGG
jgi:flagellar motility protein MotE (MotC chaperone)